VGEVPENGDRHRAQECHVSKATATLRGNGIPLAQRDEEDLILLDESDWWSAHYNFTNPRWLATAIASVRLSTSSFENTLRRCVFTVGSLMKSFVAISLLL
jgi:hypothetical protein